MNKIDNLILEMINFDAGELRLIQHLIKVHAFVKLIGSMENISPDKMEILEAVANVHDIKIKVCMEKYAKCNGKLQGKEGPVFAEKLLRRLEFKQKINESIWTSKRQVIHNTYSQIFRTESGRKQCSQMFKLEN